MNSRLSRWKSLTRADVVVTARGLGSRNGAKAPYKKVENVRKPMLWDADALNLLAINLINVCRVITPHPGGGPPIRDVLWQR